MRHFSNQFEQAALDALAILSVSILGLLYDWLRLLSKYLAVNPNEMDWHCGEQSFEREVGRKKKFEAPIASLYRQECTLSI